MPPNVPINTYDGIIELLENQLLALCAKRNMFHYPKTEEDQVQLAHLNGRIQEARMVLNELKKTQFAIRSARIHTGADRPPGAAGPLMCCAAFVTSRCNASFCDRKIPHPRNGHCKLTCEGFTEFVCVEITPEQARAIIEGRNPAEANSSIGRGDEDELPPGNEESAPISFNDMASAGDD